MSTGMYMESCELNFEAFSLGAIDIYKCFDQLSRDLIYALLAKA